MRLNISTFFRSNAKPKYTAVFFIFATNLGSVLDGFTWEKEEVFLC